LTVALVVYVGLDFCDPSLPGALNFDPDQSVDAVHLQGTRASLAAPSVAVLPPMARAVDTERPLLDIKPTRRISPRPSPAVRARGVVRDTTPAPPDDH
jgi:hypothetical protein